MANWIVTMLCTVEKEVVCCDCTEEEALQSPWDYAEDESDLRLVHWEVIKVEENV